MQNCSIYDVFNDDALVLEPFWTYSLGKKDYSSNKGKYILGTTLIMMRKPMQPFQPYQHQYYLDSQKQTCKKILFTMLQLIMCLKLRNIQVLQPITLIYTSKLTIYRPFLA